MVHPKIGLMTFGHAYFDAMADKTGLAESLATAWKDLPFSLVRPPTIPTDVTDTAATAEFFVDEKVDGIILNAGAYGLETLISVFAANTTLPLLIWCPHDGERTFIPVTAFFSFMANLKTVHGAVSSLVGNMDADHVKGTLTVFSRACLAAKKLRKASLGMIGGPCPGMLDTGFSEYHLRRVVPGLISLDTQDVLDAMAAVTEVEIKAAVDKIRTSYGEVTAEASHLTTAARSYAAMKQIARSRNLDALTVRNWPELSRKGFSGPLGASLLCDEGIICMMERDAPATATALALYFLTGRPSYMGEIDHVDAVNHELYVTNDGSMVPSLGAETGLKIVSGDGFIAITTGQTDGVTVKGTLKPGPVTISKLRGTPSNKDRLVMGIGTADALDFQQPEGAFYNARLRIEKPVDDFLHAWAQRGLEHHMIIHHQLVVEELTLLCEIIGIEPERI